MANSYIKNDAKSQFCSIADLLLQTHEEVRAAAVAWLRDNRDTEMRPGEPNTLIARQLGFAEFAMGSVENYLTAMANESCSGDAITLYAMAQVYRRIIWG